MARGFLAQNMLKIRGEMRDALDKLGQLGQGIVPLELQLFHATGGPLLRFEWDDREWSFPEAAKLVEPLELHGREVSYFQQLRAYAPYIPDEWVPIDEGGTMALGRLCAGWAVADSNGDVLFLDPNSDFSVWVFYHDRLTVKKAASSLLDWMEQARKRCSATQATPEILQALVQEALSQYVKHILIPRGLLAAQDFVVEEAGRVSVKQTESIVMERLAELITQLYQSDPVSQRAYREGLVHQIRLLGR